MEYIPQQIISFTSSNISETYPDWNPLTTYTVEADDSTLTSASMVTYGTFIYRSLVAGNQGFNPEEYLNVKWVKHSISNRRAMLDLSAQSKSYVTGGDLTVVFPQNLMTTLGIGNYDASYVLVEILALDQVTVLWSYQTPKNINSKVVDYWSYIFEPYVFEVDKATKIDLPLYGEYVRVTFYRQPDTNQSACGYCIGGIPVSLGGTAADVEFGFNSYATKETDSFGTLTIVKRAVQDVVSFTTLVNVEDTISTRRTVKSIYNDILLYVLDTSVNSIHENMMILGTIETCKVAHKGSSKTTLAWTILEAI